MKAITLSLSLKCCQTVPRSTIYAKLSFQPLKESRRKISVTSARRRRSDCYDSRKFSPQMGTLSLMHSLKFCPAPPLLCGFFRNTDGEERLGPCASKDGVYKNPEYFCYHDMSFHDAHEHMRACRMPQPNLKRKPI